VLPPGDAGSAAGGSVFCEHSGAAGAATAAGGAAAAGTSRTGATSKGVSRVASERRVRFIGILGDVVRKRASSEMRGPRLLCRPAPIIVTDCSMGGAKRYATTDQMFWSEGMTWRV
jgi:hypothetical protein